MYMYLIHALGFSTIEVVTHCLMLHCMVKGLYLIIIYNNFATPYC